jgi:hypothetical protein
VDRQALISEFGSHLDSIPDEASNQPHWLLGYAYEFFVKRIDEAFHVAGGEAGVESLIRESYKTYAKPIDIPGVPNLVVEDVVDQAIEDLLVSLVIKAHRRLHPAS